MGVYFHAMPFGFLEKHDRCRCRCLVFEGEVGVCMRYLNLIMVFVLFVILN